MGSPSLLQGIFLTQGSNSGLPHCRWILYHLSHQGSPRILEWAAYPLSSGSSQPRNQTGVSCIASRFFNSWTTREAHYQLDKFREDSPSKERILRRLVPSMTNPPEKAEKLKCRVSSPPHSHGCKTHTGWEVSFFMGSTPVIVHVWHPYNVSPWLRNVVFLVCNSQPCPFLQLRVRACVLSRFSHVQLFATYGLSPTRHLCPCDSPGKNTGVGCHVLLRGIFPTRELNPYLLGLLHCRHFLYPLRHLGSPS